MRRKVIAGNWKMNMLPNETIKFIEELAPLVKDTKNEVILCVPYTDLFYALLTAQGTNIKIGAQNMHFEEKGAYTGEVSAQMLKSINVEYVIIGHSERRQYYNETDESVNKKIKAAFNVGLKPIVCVGETLEEREAGKTTEIITNQTKLALEGLSNEQVENTIIAYEPIWAIGTGKTATSEDANNSIKEIRNKIAVKHKNPIKVRKQKLIDRINSCKSLKEIKEWEKVFSYYPVLKDDFDWDYDFFFNLI